MASKDQNPGLLSKVARFVRNPTTDWAELENSPPEADSSHGKLALKEMIERKRKNDFIRRREFAQLRTIRSRGPLSASGSLNDRNMMFQDSMASGFDDRTETLKKIDDIEAQMSRQWWETQHAPPTAVPDQPTVAEAPDLVRQEPARMDAPQTDFASTINQRTAQIYSSSSLGGGQPSDFAPTQMSSVIADLGVDFPDMLAISAARARQELPPVDGVVDLADLEEAAIRFANGDDVGAEAALLEVLQSPDAPVASVSLLAAALFDFYRATGQQERFDRAGEYLLARYGMATPSWFSVPAQLGRRTVADDATLLPLARASDPVWISPRELTVEAVASLDAALARTPMPWLLDWRALQVFEDAAVDLIRDRLEQWCDTPVKLRFIGAEALELALRQITPMGDPKASVKAWQARLAALRLFGRRDDFQIAGLDFCMSLELPPPAWQPPQCECEPESGEAHRPQRAPEVDRMAPGLSHFVRQSHSDTVPMGLTVPVSEASVALTGDVLGDASGAMAGLDDISAACQAISVSCAHLIRVDFFAAGRLLNWLVHRESEGCKVHFYDVNRLVAAFFHVIGIQEHATVTPRVD